MVNKYAPPTTPGKEAWLSPEHRLENAQLAINLCRKIGAKVYASPMDLVEGKQKMILTIFVGLMSKSFEAAHPAGRIGDIDGQWNIVNTDANSVYYLCKNENQHNAIKYRNTAFSTNKTAVL